MSYVDEVFAEVAKKNAHEPEFIQAVTEVLESLRVVIEANEEKYRKDALLERLTTPERCILFRVPWVASPRRIQSLLRDSTAIVLACASACVWLMSRVLRSTHSSMRVTTAHLALS